MNKFLPAVLAFACLSAAGAAYAQQDDDNSLPSRSTNNLRGSANPVNNEISGSMAVYPPPDTLKVRHPGLNAPDQNIVVKPAAKKTGTPKTQDKTDDNSDDSGSSN